MLGSNGCSLSRIFRSNSTEIKVRQRCALPKYSCKPLCPGCANVIIAEIEVSQRCALRQHSEKTLCPRFADAIAAEIEVRQRWTLYQHSCKTFCPRCSNSIAAKILRATCFNNLKGSVGLIMAKTSDMRISIPLDLSSRSFIPLSSFIRSRRPTQPLLVPSLVLFPPRAA